MQQDSQGRQRELLLTAPISSQGSQSGSITLTASEPGVADFSRLVVLATREGASSPLAAGADLLTQLSLDVGRFRSTDRLVRGLAESVAAPAAVFSAFRNYSPIRLGSRRMESGETLLLRSKLTLDPVTTGAWEWTLAALVPFLPDRLRGDTGSRVDTSTPSLYVATPLSAAMTHGGTATLELQADDDGIIDLSSLQLMAGLDGNEANLTQDAIHAMVIRSITLPSGEELVVGGPRGSTLGAPGTAFAALGRSNAWAHLGQFEVSEEDIISVVVENRLVPAGSPTTSPVVSAAARFYPTAR